MDKERFLDVNGFNAEYDIPLKKRMKKYRMGRLRDSSRTTISLTERLEGRSEAWLKEVRRKQVLIGVIAAIVFALVVALAVYLTFGL